MPSKFTAEGETGFVLFAGLERQKIENQLFALYFIDYYE